MYLPVHGTFMGIPLPQIAMRNHLKSILLCLFVVGQPATAGNLHRCTDQSKQETVVTNSVPVDYFFVAIDCRSAERSAQEVLDTFKNRFVCDVVGNNRKSGTWTTGSDIAGKTVACVPLGGRAISKEYSQDGRWKLLGFGADETTAFVDTASFVRKNNTVDVWVRSDFTNPSNSNFGQSALRRIRFDCSKRQFTVLSEKRFSYWSLKGQGSNVTTLRESKDSHLEPESAFELVFLDYCR